MKKNMYKRLSILAFFALSLTCCTKNEQHGGRIDHAEIRYQVINGGTKAKMSEYPKDVSFVSSAWYLPLGQNWKDHRSDAQPYISQAIISYDQDKSAFKSDTPYYWPKAGSLTFMAYSPAYDTARSRIKIDRDKGILVTGWQTNGDNQRQDLLVADIAADKTANETSYGLTGVPVVFRHILAKVSVTAYVEKVETGKTIYLKYIDFTNVYGEGDFNGSEWTNRSNHHNIECTFGHYMQLDENRKEVIETMLLIPQALSTIGERSAVQMVIGYTISEGSTNKDEEVILDLTKYNAAWERGKHTEYQIVFGTSDKPIDFEGSVSDWKDYGDTSIIIGG
ncbi:MAG TPA: hypothetical protein DCW53_00205 [Rikenellaceae bacterium]|nr:hypothetical protein [Rikenellaceae bacterium]